MSYNKVIVGVLAMFLAICFTGTVLFADELPPLKKYEGPIKPGIELTKDNWDQYRPELEKLLPISKLSYYELGVKSGLVTVPIVEINEKAPGITPEWKEAGFKYEGTARVDPETKWLEDWQGGYPFPHPKNGWELLWNGYTLLNRTSGGNDDMRFYSWFGLFDKDKYQKHFSWINQERKYLNRVEMEPFGNMEAFTKDGICFKGTILIDEPHDVRGFILLRHKYWSPHIPDDTYSYIPALKRIRRLTGGDVTDPLLGSDTIPDDFQVWQQKVTPEQTVKVVDHRDMLVPYRSYGWLEDNPDMRPKYNQDKNGVGFPWKWEMRPNWVWELSLNNPDYVYSKRVLYFDATPLEENGSFRPYWGEMYDQAGRLWRANGSLALGVNPLGWEHLTGWMFMDYLKSHYTLMNGYASQHSREEFNKYYPLDDAKAFTIKGLLREAR